MDERTYARYMSDIAYFLSKLEAQPESYYFIPLALAYNKLEKYDETISICRTGLEHFPENCATKVLLAEAYIYKGDLEQARELLFDVLTEDEDNYKALKLLGIIYQAMEMPEEAVKYLRGAYLRSPEDADLKRTIEDIGGSVDIDDIINIASRTGEAAQEDDEETKTFFEIDQKIKNAELIMADLAADKSIMGPKQEGEDEESSNLISDDELEKLIAQAETPEIAPMYKDEISSPANVVIDDELAKLMGSAGSESVDDVNAALDGFKPANIKERGEQPGKAAGEEIDGVGNGLPDGGALEGSADVVSDDLLSVLSSVSGDDDGNGGEDDLIAALGGADENEGPEDGLASALLGVSEEYTDMPEETGGGGEIADLLAALSGGGEEMPDAGDTGPVIDDFPGGLPDELPSDDMPPGDIAEDLPADDMLPGGLPEEDTAFDVLIPDDDYDESGAAPDGDAPFNNSFPVPGAEGGKAAREADASPENSEPPSGEVLSIADMIPDDDFDFDGQDLAEEEYDALMPPGPSESVHRAGSAAEAGSGGAVEGEAASDMENETPAAQTVGSEGEDTAENSPGGLDEYAPFVQSNIWEEIMDASGMDGGEGLIDPGRETPEEAGEKARKERQLKKLEEKLQKLRERTEK